MVRKFFVVDREGDNKDYGQAFEPVSGQVSEDEVRLESGLLLLFSELALLMAVTGPSVTVGCTWASRDRPGENVEAAG